MGPNVAVFYKQDGGLVIEKGQGVILHPLTHFLITRLLINYLIITYFFQNFKVFI